MLACELCFNPWKKSSIDSRPRAISAVQTARLAESGEPEHLGLGDSKMPHYARHCHVAQECRNIEQLYRLMDRIGS